MMLARYLAAAARKRQKGARMGDEVEAWRVSQCKSKSTPAKKRRVASSREEHLE
jgi:hypothetical protein